MSYFLVSGSTGTESTVETTHILLDIFLVHGGFTAWHDDGGCSTTCGGGVQMQTRSCTNPVPEFGGNDCVGNSTQSVTCNVEDCPSEFQISVTLSSC